MNKLLILLTTFLFDACSENISIQDAQEGDVVFIEGQSSQAPYIKLATVSRWSHCGIVVNTPKGKMVLEASKTVRLTPIETFTSWAKDGNWCIKRPEQTIDKKIKYRKYLGMPYDLEFKFDNGKMYCSELVWLIYHENGIDLCEPRKVSSYIMARLPKVTDLMKKRNITMEQEVVAPSDLYRALR